MSLTKYACVASLFLSLGAGGMFVGMKGCDGGREVAPPIPEPVLADVQAAASGAIRSYAEALAGTHEETASKADSYKSWKEAFDDTAARNNAARASSFRSLGDAFNQNLPTDQPYDPAKLRAEFGKAAKGFRQ